MNDRIRFNRIHNSLLHLQSQQNLILDAIIDQTNNTNTVSVNNSSMEQDIIPDPTRQNLLRNIEISLIEPFSNTLISSLNNEQNNSINIKELIENSELIIYNSVDISDEVMCSICRVNFVNNDIIRKLQCGHLFHHNCVDNWFKNHTTCPVCRYSLIQIDDNNNT